MCEIGGWKADIQTDSLRNVDGEPKMVNMVSVNHPFVTELVKANQTANI